jgi:hypothetical protein
MSEEALAFWEKRNEILAMMREKCPLGWKNHSNFCLELSLIAAEGFCSMEAKKVEAGLRQTVRELEVVSKKIDTQMEQLRSNNIFAHTDGIDWDLLRDYFAMKTNENEEEA